MRIIVYLYLFACMSYAYLGMITYRYDSSNKLNRIFFIACIDLSLWALMFTLISAVPDAESVTLFRKTATFFWSTVYCILLHFFLVMTKKDKFLQKPWKLFLFYSPALISIYLYYFYLPVTAKDIIKVPLGWASVNTGSNGFLWDQFFNIYYISYTLIGMTLIYFWGRKSNLKREKRQSKIILLTYLTVFLLGSMTDIILPILGIPLLPSLTIFFVLIPVSGIWYSMKRYRFMNLSPENVVLDVMKTMKEGMIIVNQNNVIQNLNIGALKMLGYAENELINKPIDFIYPKESALQVDHTTKSNELLLKTKNNEKLPVLISSSTLSDEWGEPFGSVLLFQDLIEIKRMQSKLQESYDELEIKVQKRTKELNRANDELKYEIEVRIKMEKEIKKLAYYDNLTSLPNKRLFNDILNKKIHESQRNELPLSVMFLDLDSFKLINDTLGHDQGDELLKQVAVRLTETLRINDTIGRIGGDEFIIIVQNTPNGQTSEIIASKLIEALQKPFHLSANEIHITASIGIAMYPIDGEDVDTLVKNADIAMYRAKENGKNQYEICTTMMKDSLVETMKLTNHLYRAIEKGEFELYYQPQVDTNSNCIVGFEALIRWNHPEMGIISPRRFIPIAENTGLIIPIGEWVLKTACRQNKVWQDQGMIAVPIAVNLSVKQFMDSNIVDKVSKIVYESGLEPRFVELEITESVLMKEVHFISDTLVQLNRLGFRISIDDFGTEYSSMKYLKQLPIDRIKIAMTFVQGITINHKDEAIINAIIALANNLEIDILAEGVETLSQIEFLNNAKCNVIQGFYFYKPMTVCKIEELFNK